MRKWIRALFILAGAVAVVVFAAPLAASNLNAGNLCGIALGLFLIVWGLIREKTPRGLRIAVRILGILGIVYLAAVAGLMISVNRKAPAEGEPVTVVVLGCKVNRSGAPSLLLRLRIDAAAEYLKAHPEAPCVCSGAAGADEPVSEAECIRRELIARGIGEERLYPEDRSTNTAANVTMAARVIRENGLPAGMLLISNSFHTLRAKMIAESLDFSAACIGSYTPKSLLPVYFLRECLAVLKQLIAPEKAVFLN